MRRSRSSVAGMIVDSFHGDGAAEWRPLEALMPLDECAAFMHMGWMELDDQRLHHYKHELTRRYLFITDELETYRSLGDYHYAPQPRKAAIRHALEGSGWPPRP